MSNSRIKYCIAFLMALAIPLASQAAEVSLTASVDKNVATMGENIVLTISVNGTQNAPQPALPESKDFQIRPYGTSSQVSIINGAMSASVKHNYILLPLREGNSTIGPAYIDYEGKRIQSQPIQIKITSAKAQAQDKNEPVFLKAEVSNASPYVNEQITYTVQLWRKVEVARANMDIPTFTGFWKEDLGKQRDFQKVVNGITYMVTEVKKSLFPNNSGKITIDPASVECEIVVETRRQQRGPFGDTGADEFLNDPFFQGPFFGKRTETKLLHSKPMVIDVKPLPSEGKPANFTSLVGQIALKTKISKDSLEMGDSTTLTLDIAGNANVHDAQIRDPKGLDNFKVYDDKPTTAVTAGPDGVTGQKSFKKAFVPMKSGSLQIPEFEVPYFNPKTGHYEIAHNKPIALNVLPAKEGEKLHAFAAPISPVQKDTVKVLGSDISPIYAEMDALQQDGLEHKHFIFFGLFTALPFVAFLSMLTIRMQTERKERMAGHFRKKDAYKKADKSLQLALKAGSWQKFYGEVARVIKEYLGDKFGIAGGALTPQEVEAKLRAAGVGDELIAKVKALMEECEYCQFSSASAKQGTCESVYQNTRQILKQLDKTLR